MEKYRFYFQQADKAGNSTAEAKDIETVYQGLMYLSCEGLESRGAIKDTITEEYAEQDGARSFHPSDLGEGHNVHHKATEVKFRFLFTGQDRRTVYDAFRAFIESSRLLYWDTARHKKVFLMLSDATDPEEDTLKGTEYIISEFTFINLWGIGKTCNDTGEIV